MATYSELFELRSDSTLRNRVAVACIVAAETIRNELDTVPNHANRLIWAADVFADPKPHAVRMLWELLAANKDATSEAITTATDMSIQTKVDATVDLFATGI